MTRIQSDDQFTSIFKIDGNSSCFQCGKQAKQWVETRHAIFLCLACATKFKEIERFAYIKSVALQQWNEDELEKLSRGGNAKFREFLSWYNLQDANPEIYLRSKAAEFYRIYLMNPEKLKLSDGPTI